MAKPVWAKVSVLTALSRMIRENNSELKSLRKHNCKDQGQVAKAKDRFLKVSPVNMKKNTLAAR